MFGAHHDNVPIIINCGAGDNNNEMVAMVTIMMVISITMVKMSMVTMIK